MKKENRFFNVLLKRILVFLLVIVTVITSFNTFKTTYASTNTFPYDASPILEDLQSTREFNLSDYTASTTKTPAIVNFVEWCYSVKKPNDFALYIYFYNPQQWLISENGEGNLVTMAVSYNSEGAPADYESFKLVFCNKSDNGLLYKFRIEDHESADRNNIQSRVNSELRRYDISAITFDITNVGAKTVAIGGCFKFSGFAKGYGDSDISTLKSEGVTNTETLTLVVNPTVYRTAGSELGGNHQVDVNSVYFSVPEKYFTEYGNLQKIKAEWWEYKLKPMMTFKSDSQRTEIEPFLGQNIGYHTDGIDTSYYEYYNETFATYSGFTYNVPSNYLESSSNPNIINTLYLGFVSEDGYVPRNVVEEAIYGYNKTYNKGYLDIGGHNISLDIFEDAVDEGRTQGYNLQEIDADDKFNLLNYSDDINKFWSWAFGLHNYTDKKDITPIESNISEETISLDKTDLSKELLINEDDVDDFKQFYKDEKKAGNRTVLFRFAQTDYYSKLLSSKENIDSIFSASKQNAWVYYQTVFLNFRIIQLTFSKIGNSMVIPVAQDPIDIINTLSPNPNDVPWTPDFNKGNRLLAILILVATIFACAGLLIVAIIFSKLISKIESKTFKTILFILLALTFFVALFCGLTYAIGLINSYGGL